MSERRRIFTLNDPYALRVNKELAKEIGFQESIVFLQIEFLQSISKHVFDGERWTRATLGELHTEHFPWWSTATISRILNRLQSQSLIKTANYNKAEYDRTQWFAIDEEGASNLHSIAILQPETAVSSDIADCNVETDKLQDPSLQNETTIPETYKRELSTERRSNERQKNPADSPPTKVKSLSDSEAQKLWDNLCENDPCGDELRQLSEVAAGENRRGEKAITAVWNQIGRKYIKARDSKDYSEEAWRYGFEEAISRGKGGMEYVIACAKGYRPDQQRKPRSLAVVGATDADYEADPFDYEGARGGSNA